MVGLVDIAPAAEKVTVGEIEVPVYGVTAHGVANLFGRFPELRKLMTGKGDVDALFAMGPDIVVAIIGAGVGEPGDTETEAAARKQPLGVQTDFLEKIIELTLPGGFGPFVAQVERMGLLRRKGVKKRAQSGKKPGSKSPKPSSS